MNKSELTQQVANRTKLPAADVARVIDAFARSVASAVIRGDKVVLSGFGTFHRKPMARRMARNIATGQTITVPATNIPAFRPGRPFREAVGRRRRPRVLKAATPKAQGTSRVSKR